MPHPSSVESNLPAPGNCTVCSSAEEINRFRKEQELEKEKKPSVLKKLNEAKVDVPKKSPGKAKEAEL